MISTIKTVCNFPWLQFELDRTNLKDLIASVGVCVGVCVGICVEEEKGNQLSKTYGEGRWRRAKKPLFPQVIQWNLALLDPVVTEIRQ